MEKSILYIIFTFIITLFCVLIIMGAEYWITNQFLIPILESIVILCGIWFIYKNSQGNYFFIVFLFSLWFIIFETSIYALGELLNFTNFGMKDLVSWRLLYNSVFTFIWIPLTCYGLKYKDKSLLFLFFIFGICLHLIFNLFMDVVS